MLPPGLPIWSPPANALPPGTEWQATQSPARATYSPLLGAASSARATGAAANIRSSEQRIAYRLVATFHSPGAAGCARPLMVSIDVVANRVRPENKGPSPGGDGPVPV